MAESRKPARGGRERVADERQIFEITHVNSTSRHVVRRFGTGQRVGEGGLRQIGALGGRQVCGGILKFLVSQVLAAT
jgi:hypothetical protein